MKITLPPPFILITAYYLSLIPMSVPSVVRKYLDDSIETKYTDYDYFNSVREEREEKLKRVGTEHGNERSTEREPLVLQVE